MEQNGGFNYKELRRKEQKFVRYKEGSQLYSMGMSKFQEIAKKAGAVYKVNQMVGQRIQALRMSKEIAAVELVSFLNIGRNQMSRIENGRANCTLQQMFLLAQILECSVDYLMFGKKEKQQFSSEQMEAVENMIKAFAM
jgi:DNA-binding XRE family transcriptional regulator